MGSLLSQHLGPPDRLLVDSSRKKHYSNNDKGSEADLTMVLTVDHSGAIHELRPLAEGNVYKRHNIAPLLACPQLNLKIFLQITSNS